MTVDNVKWHTRPITRAQYNLIGEICRTAEIAMPDLTNRGEALAFIQQMGGDPLFPTLPVPPALRERS